MKELTQSIEHWKRIVSLAKAQDAEGLSKEGWYGGSCALCQEYACKYACAGCPVAEYTGEGACDGSPWHEADASLRAVTNEGGFPDNWAHAIYCTQKELGFLRSLKDE